MLRRILLTAIIIAASIIPARAGLVIDNYRYSYDPGNISTLALWYDASEAATITESSGAVSQWDDKSGNDDHLTSPGAAGTEPTTGVASHNGRNVLRLDGSNDYMRNTAITSMANTTVFIVYRSMIDPLPNNSIQSLIATKAGGGGSPGWGVYGKLFSSTTDRRIRVESNASSVQIYKNGVPGTAGHNPGTAGDLVLAEMTIATIDITSVTANTTLQIGAFIGEEGTFHGEYDIGEILIFNGVLSSADKNLVGNYLSQKWAISWTTI